MRKENASPGNVGDVRMTRARAAALDMRGKFSPFKEIRKQISRPNTKKVALDENNPNAPNNGRVQRKRKAVLQDVTNVCCDNVYKSCFNAAKVQVKNARQVTKGQLNVSKVAPSVAAQLPRRQADSTSKIVLRTVETAPKLDFKDSTSLEKHGSSKSSDKRKLDRDDFHHLNQSSKCPSKPYESIKTEKYIPLEDWMISCGPEVADIDCDKKDPQLCSIYAADIYSKMRVSELDRRPSPTYMETIQEDISQSMRGILVDWLVEVSEEYKLVPDTLYLTVYFIDWFLSHNCIQRHRLQLLGITCMLIASKYDEISAPRVEEFCFITDNTYTKGEVLDMEIQVLKYLGFNLFAPTAKTFLRRFLRAAQASYKSPSYELEFLANYFSELTLLHYNILNFLPSVIAASSVFLARWTLDQTTHPWNPTLEHYTSYKPSDLKAAVLALQELQLNTTDCPLNAIRMKYRQQKFKSVAVLSSPKLLETLF